MDDPPRRKVARVRETMAELKDLVRNLEAARAKGRPTGATEIEQLRAGLRDLRRVAKRLQEEAQDLTANLTAHVPVNRVMVLHLVS